ncbi:PEP-CTERM sorting domain-containing protein [Candidatus Auribacterota bacterium]
MHTPTSHRVSQTVCGFDHIKANAFVRVLAAFLIFIPASLPFNAEAALNLKFVNDNTDYGSAYSSDVYVLFTTAPSTTFNATYDGGTSVQLKHSYTFQEIGSDGVQISDITGGVLYVSVGDPMTNDRSSAPSFNNTSDDDYYTRWDQWEITYTGQASDDADLTGINAYALPLRLTTYNGGTGGTQKQDLGYNISGTQMKNELGALTSNDPTAVLTDTRQGYNNAFLRVIGPTTFAAGTIGPYQDLQPYVNAVKSSVSTGTTVAKIVDNYSGPQGGSGRTASQSYNFQASFNASGDLVLDGSGSVVGSHTITIAAADVAYQIYAADPSYEISGVGTGNMADNDVYAAAIRDILAGFATGFVGSTVTDPETGEVIKDEESNKWWVCGLTFDEVQTANVYYNAYGGVFYQNSNNYGFPFSDRLNATVQASLDPANVDTLVLTVAADAIPEPSSVALFAISLFALAGITRRKLLAKKR